MAACAALVVAGALAQRGALVPPGPEALWGAVALAPWVACVWRPLPAWLFGAAVGAGAAGLLADPANSDVTPFLLLLLAAGLGATEPPATVVAGVGAISAGMVLLSVPHESGGWWVWVPGIVAAAVCGFAARTQVRLLAQERAVRTAMAARLAADDRRRVAREVHDVIAHSLGVTMLHVTAARHALEADADVDEAVDALREAERLGRAAMGDIRRTVGLLDAGAADGRPLPGLDDLPALVDEFRSAGLDVGYSRRGDVEALSPAVGLDLYRVAQESLANVARHAPGAAARVVLDARPDEVELRVEDTGPAGPPAGAATGPAAEAPGGGRGIRGMRERVALLGGRLDAGPAAGGWRVVALLPRHPVGP
jgi:signal transduction histidine kinase